MKISVCYNCGKEFTYDEHHNKGKFCCRDCVKEYTFNKVMKLSDIIVENINSGKTTPYFCELLGLSNVTILKIFKKCFSPEVYSKFLENNKRNKSLANYKNGFESSLIKFRTYKKDKCELCGSTENLQSHHKVPGIYDDKNENLLWADNSPENHMTLCSSCHQKIHYQQLNRKGIRYHDKLGHPIKVRNYIYYKVSEIFNSVDGESRRSGKLSTFIRLAGCNCCCDWCDTKWSISESAGNYMTLEEILDWVQENGYTNITLTGGEPLIHPGVDDLIIALSKLGHDVSIETNGTINVGDKSYYNLPNVWFSMDYKCPSSGMTDKMISAKDMTYLRGNDTLKFVVADMKDMECAYNRIKTMETIYNRNHVDNKDRPTYYFSCVFGRIPPTEVIQFMKDNHLCFRTVFQLQIHKIIWNSEERGV